MLLSALNKLNTHFHAHSQAVLVHRIDATHSPFLLKCIEQMQRIVTDLAAELFNSGNVVEVHRVDATFPSSRWDGWQFCSNGV
jgi:hypothetical protein